MADKIKLRLKKHLRTKKKYQYYTESIIKNYVDNFVDDLLNLNLFDIELLIKSETQDLLLNYYVWEEIALRTESADERLEALRKRLVINLKMKDIEVDNDNVVNIFENKTTIAQKVFNLRAERSWLSIENGYIPLDYAEDLIKESAWWHTHSSGKSVRAPKHSKNIYNSEHGWAIDFGANTFLISRAISHCNYTINKEFDKIIEGEKTNLNDLKGIMFFLIRGAVANKNGGIYNGYYPLQGKDMKFGAQSVNVNEAANYILLKSGIFYLL